MNLMTENECVSNETLASIQPSEYSSCELEHLKGFIQLIKSDEKRSQLVCWGNHSDYNHGY
jgi:hypothetical protein